MRWSELAAMKGIDEVYDHAGTVDAADSRECSDTVCSSPAVSKFGGRWYCHECIDEVRCEREDQNR